MSNKMKQFFKSAIKYLSEYGVKQPIMVLSPLIQNMYQNQFNKLVSHINSCENFSLRYENNSGGYNEGVLVCRFEFASSKPKIYEFNFSSKLTGEYGTTEWWQPIVSCSVTEDVGNTIAFRGMQNDFMKFEVELKKVLSNEEEINKLKNEIAVKQRELAKLTAKAS